MPGIPLVAREFTADQMCRQGCRPHLSEEEEIAAEESLSIYCKPVELYNILQRRAIKNPSFLQRCLRYKVQAKHKRRVQMSVSVSGTLINGFQYQNLFPICIMLAKPVADFGVTDAYSAVYRFSRAVILNTSTGVEGIKQTEAKFTLPDINKLEGEIKSGSLCVLFVSFARLGESISAIDLTKYCTDVSYFPSNIEGYCLFGKIPLEILHLSWEKSPNLSLGEKAEMMSTIEMHSSFMKLSCTDEDKFISFQTPYNSGAVPAPKQVEVIICAEEVGAKDKSPYDSYTYNSTLNTSLSNIIRLRSGNVVFNYRYFNNKLQRTEVTEDFSCPFCLAKCASFKGLRCHLSASHDLFNFEFWVTDELQAVNVSVKTEVGQSEVVADGVDPKQQTFFFCSKLLKRRKATNLLQNSKHVHPLIMDSDYPSAVNEVRDKADGIADFMDRDIPSPDITGMSTATAHSHSYADPECIQSIAGSNLGPPVMLQFAKTRKLSIERSDPRNRAFLQKRPFFHSHRAQPMALEQVLSDRDSEDEVDDDVADFEDRRMLDDFVDVTKHEKQMMHMWNSFVRKQRILADNHVPWGCVAFSKMHGTALVQSPPLLWCWRLFLIKLWNHGLLDARNMNNCNVILEQIQKKDAEDPVKKS
ncbi:polycomb group protein EMBRYONIC FLOWER 2-like isoform X2 [Impatiens glandulifera]|uniref:polycomb group protein EMBRYONIC FLOWER 2-like isoform X2 n=1 Tax=Impatiens glandulifera TaxID=253017 RepID=UPI001FB08880|nr:polycomb group protein EMBRYONIC FLOWER 2-like isoform X2 [Impatiens glandulifera]XP_047320115.1 polycomb group protein EMBRYONIC FLOWER 2-like isoform X2 [Impatiens glandulifera]